MQRVQQTPDTLTVRDIPFFYLSVQLLLSWMFFSALMSDNAPAWITWLLGIMWLGIMVGNTTIWGSSHFDGKAQSLTIKRFTFFGPRTVVLSAEDLVDLHIDTLIWGRRGASKTPLHTLQVRARNHLVNVVVSSSDKQTIDACAAKIREMFDLKPVQDEDVTPLPDVPAQLLDAVREVCERFAERNGFTLWADVTEDDRARLSKALKLADNDEVLLHVEPGVLRTGQMGLAVGCRGLYWHNDPMLDAFTRFNRLSWQALPTHELSEDPHDDDVLLSGGGQISLGGLLEPGDVLEMLKELQQLSAAQSSEATD